LQSGWLDLNQRGPASDAGGCCQALLHPDSSFSPLPRPTKKARGRVTPGLQWLQPEEVGVTVAKGRWPASSAGNRPGPLPASAYHRISRDCVPSCPLLRPPGTEIFFVAAPRLRRGHLVDERTRLEVHQSGQICSGSCRPRSLPGEATIIGFGVVPAPSAPIPLGACRGSPG